MKEKIKKYLLLLLAIILGGLFLLNTLTLAHPGRTDARGCHTCRTNCPSWGLSYGEYHCHRAKGLPQPEPPIKSHRNGYTEPAPEYELPEPRYEPPAAEEKKVEPEKFIAEVPKEGDGGGIIWWIIGVGVTAYIFYALAKSKKKKGKGGINNL